MIDKWILSQKFALYKIWDGFPPDIVVQEAQTYKSSSGQQEPVFPWGAGSKINKVLVKESSNYLSDILSLGLCTNCSENHLNCSCSHEILCEKCYVKRSSCNCIKKCFECNGFISTDKIDIDNVRYSIETKEFFQRQIEEAVNTLINKNNTESDKAFSWFMN